MEKEVLEGLSAEHLQFVVQQSLDHVRTVYGEQTTLFDNGLKLIICEDEALQDRFPALIKPNDPTKLYFEETQFGKLVRDISDHYDVTPEGIARLYVGSSLTTAILEHGISPMQPAKVDRLYTVLSNTDELFAAINRVDEELGDEERFMTALNVMTSNEQRICKINALRFAVGAFFMVEAQQGDPDYGDLMTKSFRETLHKKLAGRENYIKLFKALGNTEEQAEMSFSEKISSIELAVCFPMSSAEATTIMNISQSHDNRIYKEGQDTVVIASEFQDKNGFYDPEKQETRTYSGFQE